MLGQRGAQAAQGAAQTVQQRVFALRLVLVVLQRVRQRERLVRERIRRPRRAQEQRAGLNRIHGHALAGAVQHRHEELRDRIGLRRFFGERPQDARRLVVVAASDRDDAVARRLCARVETSEQYERNQEAAGANVW